MKRYSITKDHTYMIYDFMQDRKHYCIVDVFVSSMGRDKFTPKVMSGGNKLSIGMVSPKFFFQYDRLKLANILNVGFNENSHKATAFEEALRDMRKELKVKKGGEISGEDIIIPLPFRCDQHIVRWGLLSFENKDKEVVDKHNPDVQMNDILSLQLLSEERIESDEEEKGEVLVFKSPVRRGRSKVDSAPPVGNIRTRSSVSTKKRMRTTTKRSATNTKGSPQSGRESFETAAMVINTEVDADGDGDGDDGDLSEDDLSVFPV